MVYRKFKICKIWAKTKLKSTKIKLVFNRRIRYDKFKTRIEQSNNKLFYAKSKVII